MLMRGSPIEKDQLVTGEWTIIVMSNNGDGGPIGYQRDFSLIVGPPITTTITSIVTVPVVSTPLTSVTGEFNHTC
jgi:hypothetical protein